MKRAHQADDPFICFGAKPDKGLDSRFWTRPEVGKGTPESQELEEGTHRRQLATGDAEGQWAVDTGHQKRPVGMR